MVMAMAVVFIPTRMTKEKIPLKMKWFNVVKQGRDDDYKREKKENAWRRPAVDI